MAAATSSSVGEAGYLVFLLFIPVFSTVWIWMIVSKPAVIFYGSQAFFNFLAMCCFASVAAFQAHWKIGPSGLSGFAVFISVIGILFPLFLLFVPVVYEKYNKGARLARAMSEPRVGFICTGAGVTVSLLIAFITTISAWTEPGCKDASNDPHAKALGSSFTNALPGWCSTKKAGAVFFWFVCAFWIASFVLTVLDWRNGKSVRPRDPPFTVPVDMEDGYTETGHDDDESAYGVPKPEDGPFADSYAPPGAAYAPAPAVSGYPSVPSVGPAAARPSIDAYGAFSDPAPSGFGAGEPRVSRTMQYADPYAAVRASIAGSPGATGGPPGYSSYGGGY